MSYTIFSCGVEYQLESWSFNADYTKKIAVYVSNDGGQITKIFNA